MWSNEVGRWKKQSNQINQSNLINRRSWSISLPNKVLRKRDSSLHKLNNDLPLPQLRRADVPVDQMRCVLWEAVTTMRNPSLIKRSCWWIMGNVGMIYFHKPDMGLAVFHLERLSHLHRMFHLGSIYRITFMSHGQRVQSCVIGHQWETWSVGPPTDTCLLIDAITKGVPKKIPQVVASPWFGMLVCETLYSRVFGIWSQKYTITALTISFALLMRYIETQKLYILSKSLLLAQMLRGCNPGPHH